MRPVLAAVEAGVDAVDAAIDAMSGLTSQPNLGSIVAALQRTERETGIDPTAVHDISRYWETVRHYYRAFESDMRAGSSDVYEHEMPGGQYTNLREQASGLGLGERWADVTKTYATVNRLFGDIVKVTPTSKVVGDMALFMVASDVTETQVLDPGHEIDFPQSVVEFFHGDLGQPPGGFPAELQRKVLRGEPPLKDRPGASLAACDFDIARKDAAEAIGRELANDRELASYLMYPAVFIEFAQHDERYGAVERLPTPVFFFGMHVGQEIAIELERGKSLALRFAALGEPDEDGARAVYFELNGQPRTIKVRDQAITDVRPRMRKAEAENPLHVAAPMPGQIVKIAVADGGSVRKGDALLVIEAMKMQSVVTSSRDAVVENVLIPVGARIEAGDLLVVLADA